MAPPAKKQKISPSNPKVFTTLQNLPDTRLFVFNQEFQVLASALKIHTTFFDSTLKPDSGSEPASSSPLFKLDYYTTLDKEGGWILTSDPDHNKKDLIAFNGKRIQEEKAFNNILSAIFNKEYRITDAAELNSMASLAECYGALQVVSNSLTGPFYTSSGLLTTIGKDPAKLLQSACKLRHKGLFRESFIYSLGPWSDPQYKNLTDRTLFNLADGAYKALEGRIMKIHMELFQIAANSPGYSESYLPNGTELVQSLAALAPKCLNDSGEIIMPKFLRSCANACSRKYPRSMRQF